MNNVEWVNIPASYLLACHLCTLGLIALLHPRHRGWLRCGAALLAVGVVYAVTLFSNPRAEGLRFFLCMAVIWIGLPVCIKACVDIPWRDAGYFAVRGFFLSEFAASLLWQVTYYIMTRRGVSDKLRISLAVVPVGLTTFFGAVWLVERLFRKELYELRVQRKDLVTVLFTGIFFYFMANISYVLSDSPFNAAGLPETYILRTLTEFGAVAMLLAYHVRIIDLQTRLRAQAMENEWRLQADHYRTYEASIALVNRKYHDLKHQLYLLRESATTEEKLGYIDQMEQELEAYGAQCQTGNAAMDVLLTAKRMECDHAGIALTCVADGAALSFMHPLDLNALFGNLLDNAIDCELCIADAEKRLIHLSVARQKGYARIHARNICEESVVFRDGLPLSTKGDDQYHGYGAASIRDIVEKYGGSLLMRCEDGWFEVSILMPIP